MDKHFIVEHRSTTEVVLVKYTGSDATVVVPDGVTVIGKYAFHSNTFLKRVVLPDGVTTIESFAYQGCKALKDVVFPKSLVSIDFYAFNGRPLTSVVLSSNVNEFDIRAFDSDVAIAVSEDNPNFTAVDGVVFTKDMHTLVRGVDVERYVVPDGVEVIGDEAFRWFKSLREVVFPEGLTTIEPNAFAGCSLTSVVLPSTLKKLSAVAFDLDVTISVSEDNPYLIVVDGVVFTKDMHTLVRGVNVEKYVVPAGVKRIESGAFRYCKVIKEVVLPHELEIIGDDAFSACKELVTVALPDGLTTIGNGAFCSNCSLNKIDLPESLTTIGVAAFGGTALESVVIPSSVSTFVKSFTSNVEFVLSEDNPYVASFDGVIFTKDMTTLLRGVDVEKYVVPAGVKRIGEGAFAGMPTLREIVFPPGLEIVERGAFHNCRNLEAVVFSDGLTTIGSSAFHFCKKLTKITFPRGLTTIGGGAFAHCRRLEEVVLPEGLTSIGEGAFSYTRLRRVTVPASVVQPVETFLDPMTLKRMYPEQFS